MCHFVQIALAENSYIFHCFKVRGVFPIFLKTEIFFFYFDLFRVKFIKHFLSIDILRETFCELFRHEIVVTDTKKKKSISL